VEFLPVFLAVRDQECVVVGGGVVAARKVAMLRRAGARVRVVAPKLCATLGEMAQAGEIHARIGLYADSDLDGATLVVAATSDAQLNGVVSAAARARQLPVNVVDHPELCSFILPSIVDRSPVIVAISTGGASPVLARLWRARLEAMIPAGLGHVADVLRKFRDRVKGRIPEMATRRRFWEHLLHGPLMEMAIAGKDQEAEAIIEQALERCEGTQAPVGDVALVGAGPGDPDLLTFRALRLMQEADVVLYDRLVAPQILDMVRREAERIYVGKRRAYHAVRQEEINQTLVRLAREGKRVVRLKGGDPFVFGRGGEEIASLTAEGIPFQVVPGITAANGCAAYAGIPLTHRDFAQSVIFVTGHLKDGRINLDWGNLVKPQLTVVIYMGLMGLERICEELQRHGMSPDTPAALIEDGTTARQRVLAGTVANLPSIIVGSAVHAPTLLIVGEVVRLRQSLAWFNGKPA
jgi:uroporphyrin-III C-methyltransferase/precorrin-2 dehydrogenase/sirohydrochlorin ferrochelatase